MNELTLTSLTLDDLKSIISESVSTELKKHVPQQPPQQEDELLKIDDVAKMLNVSKVTIFTWKKQGKIPFYRMANKIFFKKSEVMESLKRIGGRAV